VATAATQNTHLLPDQFAKAFTDLNAKEYLPIHWGVFTLAPHAWNEPIFELMQAFENDDPPITIPMIGQTITVGEPFGAEDWWATSE